MDKATDDYNAWINNVSESIPFKDLPVFKNCIIDKSWYNFFISMKSYLIDINNTLQDDILVNSSIYPDNSNIFSVFKTPLNEIKVVILGKAPTIEKNKCNETKDCGLAFSIKRNDMLSNEIINIYKAVKNDIPDFNIPAHGDLSSWTKNGIFLLNMILTARKNDRYAHAILWEGFIDKVIHHIQNINPNVVFLIWCSQRPEKMQCSISNRTKCYISSYPFDANINDFINCRHFTKTNKYLIRKGIDPINWSIE